MCVLTTNLSFHDDPWADKILIEVKVVPSLYATPRTESSSKGQGGQKTWVRQRGLEVAAVRLQESNSLKKERQGSGSGSKLRYN